MPFWDKKKKEDTKPAPSSDSGEYVYPPGGYGKQMDELFGRGAKASSNLDDYPVTPWPEASKAPKATLGSRIQETRAKRSERSDRKKEHKRIDKRYDELAKVAKELCEGAKGRGRHAKVFQSLNLDTYETEDVQAFLCVELSEAEVRDMPPYHVEKLFELFEERFGIPKGTPAFDMSGYQ